MQTTLKTLRSDLHLLILRHTLPETLDRLLSMTTEQCDLEQDGQFAAQWNELILHLERATRAAVALAQLKEARGEELWR